VRGRSPSNAKSDSIIFWTFVIKPATLRLRQSSEEFSTSSADSNAVAFSKRVPIKANKTYQKLLTRASFRVFPPQSETNPMRFHPSQSLFGQTRDGRHPTSDLLPVKALVLKTTTASSPEG
jgi:hypothetical protein